MTKHDDDTDGPGPDAETTDQLWEQAEAAYEAEDIDTAIARLESILELEPDDADAWHFLGCCREDNGDAEGTAAAFARVFELDEKEHAASPLRLDEAAFDAILNEAIESLDDELRAALDQVAVRIEEYPGKWILEDADVSDPRLIGLTIGPTLAELKTSDSITDEPPQILLYQRNLEREFDDDELAEEIAITLLHELGHFLGLSEEELAERGLE